MPAHVAGKLLIAKNRQPLFQTQLKPVAAGDAVAGPVVEVLMRHDAFDELVIAVCRGLGRGEDVFGVEDIQSLVFHRTRVEVIHGNKVEDVQIIVSTVNLFVPRHRALQAVQRIGAAILITGADPDVQCHIASIGRAMRTGMRNQIASHQREQVRGLRPRIVPDREPVAAFNLVAVGQKHRLIAFEADGEGRHHVGPIRVVGDFAKALRLALCAEQTFRGVETFQLGIGFRVDLNLAVPGKRLGRDVEAEALGDQPSARRERHRRPR